MGSMQCLLLCNVSFSYVSIYWSVIGLVFKYQLLQDVNVLIGKFYDWVLQIIFMGNCYDIGGFDFSIIVDFICFVSGDLIGGDCVYVM